MRRAALLLALAVPGCIEDRARVIHNDWPEPVRVFVDWDEDFMGEPMPVSREYTIEPGETLWLSFDADQLPVHVAVLRIATSEWIYVDSWYEGDFNHDVWLTPPQ